MVQTCSDCKKNEQTAKWYRPAVIVKKMNRLLNGTDLQ